jgi:GT2 family glycosyltransferase
MRLSVKSRPRDAACAEGEGRFVKWPGAAPRIDLDQPVPRSAVADSVEIVGWSFSRRSRIERIEASLDGAPPVALAHGQLRPDVASLHGCHAACGFAGALALNGIPAGPLTLLVTAVDAAGRRASRRVILQHQEVKESSIAAASLEIDEVQWRGAELELSGHARGPGGVSWRKVVVAVDGVGAGEARFGLSRPELGPEAGRSGFHFRGELPAHGELTLCAETPSGQRLQRALRRPGRAEGSGLSDLRRLLHGLQDEQDRDITVLDATTLGLAAALPGLSVVRPLDPRRLPYVDGTFDVVAIGEEPDREAEARRLARYAVVRARSDGRVDTVWRRTRTGGRRRVSVVIPVFNQSACTDACIAGVLATWPESLDGEILVVDDASTDDTAALLARWAARDARVRPLRQAENGGFTASCNAGAQAATGDTLVFLNNDTVPRPGWLPPLLSCLARDRVGAVGGKLLYPDGSLQEAGGVIFADGDGCNFGKGVLAPDDPLADYVREVDYGSGALLATPRALFLELGGFDPAYSPAYYEDADYAFRLRQHGYRVLYQPASAIVHLEGMTAGRDVERGVKQHQVRNRATFVARWAEALREQPPHPDAIDRAALHRLRARTHHTRRALVVLPTMPERDREGGSRRAFHLLELLTEDGWATSVVVENANGGERYARAVRQLGAAIYSGFSTRWAGADYLPDPAALLALETFDLALLAFWHVAERLLPALRARSPRTRAIVDSVDLHFLRGAREAFARARAGGSLDALDTRYADELRRELNVYGAADGVLTVSQKEAGWVDDLTGTSGHALCVPLMEDPPAPPRPLRERRGLVFLANFRHPPNLDALAFLAEVVARLDPGLLAAHPLDIVGNALEPAMLGALAGHPCVRAVGWVPEVEPYLEHARVSLVPLRQGAGTKAKLLQSLFAGTPSVSTTIGVEGFGLVNDRDVLVADTADAFAAAITRLATDDEEWRRLSARGRAAVEDTHGRAAVRTQFRSAIEDVLARPSGRR